MKTHKILLYSLFLFCLISACKEEKPIIADKHRPSITFIMGQDKDLSNPFYQSAAAYYCQNAAEKTDEVVHDCHSLAEVTAWLRQHTTKKGLPYGVINIIVHGNPWVGCRIGDKGKRVESAQIEEAIEAGEIVPLDENKFDAQTEIRLLSCGLGAEKDLLKAIGRAFAGSEHIIVRSPLFFIVYDKQKENQRFLAEYWHIAERENTTDLAQFQQKYPNTSIRWEAAMQQDLPRFEGDSYLHTFAIPFRWTFQLQEKSDIPNLADEAACKKWLAQKSEIQSKLADIHFSLDDFHWQYWAEYTNEQLCFKVKGICNVRCVLRYLPKEKSLAWDDEKLYCTVRL